MDEPATTSGFQYCPSEGGERDAPQSHGAGKAGWETAQDLIYRISYIQKYI